MKKFLTWAIVIIFFFLVISINTTKIDMSGGIADLFDFTKWQNVTYWVQLIANTLFLVMLYATILVSKKNALIETDEGIEDERTKLFSQKDIIISKNKRGLLDDYLELIVNTDEKLEERAYLLEVIRKRVNKALIRWMFKRLIYRIDEEIELITKYRVALRSDIEQLKSIEFNIHKIARVKKPVTFDTLFDIMDVSKPNRKVRIGYSDNAEARKLIAKSPISSVITVFLSILAFGNVLTINSDWKSVVLIISSVTVAALLKWFNAIKDAETIAKNKRRSLAKANDEVGAFLNFPTDSLKQIRDAMFKKPEPKPIVEKEKAIQQLPAIKKDVRDWQSILNVQT